MAVKSANSPRIVATAGDLGDSPARFRRRLRAENVSPNTILAYCGAAERLAEYLVASELPTDVGAIRRDHLRPLSPMPSIGSGPRPRTIASEASSCSSAGVIALKAVGPPHVGHRSAAEQEVIPTVTGRSAAPPKAEARSGDPGRLREE